MVSTPKFLALDGNSLLHRAFHALPLLTTAQGEYTNAVYGFLTMFFKLLDIEQPEAVVVAFDLGKPQVRIRDYPAYKGNRAPTAPELKSQFGLLKEILAAMQITMLERADYEADDLLGSAAKAAVEEGFSVVIVTGDRDLLQMVSEQITVKICRRGIADVDVFTPEAVVEKYTLKPEQIPDLKGLMGDASDNIPGVPGIGEKTGIKLLHQYPTVELVLENIASVKGKKLQQSLTEHRENALLSKKLATILVDLPVLSVNDCQVREYDGQRLKQLFQRLEFKSLLKRLAIPAAVQPEIRLVTDVVELQGILQEIRGEKIFAFMLHLDRDEGMQAELVDITLAWAGKTVRVDPSCCSLLQDVLEDPDIEKYGHDIKPQLLFLWRMGIRPVHVTFDTMLAAYLLNPARSSYLLAELAEEYLLDDPGAIWVLRDALEKALIDQEMQQLFLEVEMPLLSILAEMEFRGIALDTEYLAVLSGELAVEIEALEEKIYHLAGTSFNINSPKQLGTILFEKLGLPVGKKTKTGYSTNADVLEFLRDKHLIIEEILQYRQLSKVKSTYVDALPKLVNATTGRLHTSLNQTVTATGRLSSSNPNLQNIPIRGELGKKIRQAFIVEKEDGLLMAADYSQIELRILAHITGDENLCQAFIHDLDIHAQTAAEVFGVPLSEVDGEMRSRAKAVNFGIVYGISDFGLAQNIQVSPKEAKRYIESYFLRYPKVKRYMETVVAEAKEKGFVTTILQRRRYLPDLKSTNHNVRSFAERMAINTPIQGSAADIIKLAMIKVDQALREQGLQARMVLQVHDELILEVPKEELEKVHDLVVLAMASAVELVIPLEVGTASGKNWTLLKK